MPYPVKGLLEVYEDMVEVLLVLRIFFAELQRRTQAMEIWCHRNILRISYKDHVTNEEVRAKIKQAIGPHEDLLTIVKARHCSSMDMSPVHQVWPKPSCKAQ